MRFFVDSGVHRLRRWLPIVNVFHFHSGDIMRAVLLLLPAALLALAMPASTQTLGTPGAEIVFLVTDCGAAGHTLGTDCFEDIASLRAFLWDPVTGLNPSAGSPALVDVGAGNFVGPLECPSGAGFVTFRGAGRDRSRILGPSTILGWPGLTWAMDVTNCQALGFQDLSVIAEASPGANIAVRWSGAGSSTWTDVDIRGAYAGWYDFSCGGDADDPPAGEHRFYGATITAGGLAYYAECGATWLYGSEVRVQANANSITPLFGYTGIGVSHRGDVRVYGSAVRVGGSAFPWVSSAAGVRVGPSGNSGTPDGSGTFHMHGGVIAVDTSAAAGIDVVGLLVNDAGGSGDAMGHTPDTGFMVKGGAGADVARVAGDGHVMSPFLWQSGSAEPVSGLQSLTGQDLYVETDCDASGDCSGSGTPPLQPHLMIYSANCTSRWLDSVTGSCRP